MKLFSWNVFLRFYPDLLHGYVVTIEYAVITITLSLTVGTMIGVIYSQRLPFLWRPCKWFVTFIRETPLLVQMFFIYYSLPYLGIFFSASVSGIVAITLNEGAFIAEIIRGGIQGVSERQKYAAAALGMSRVQMLRYVILPQAFRNVGAALLGQTGYVLKDTSLLMLIAVVELTGVAQNINTIHFEPGTAFISAAVLYIVTFSVLNGFAYLLQRRGGKWISQSS